METIRLVQQVIRPQMVIEGAGCCCAVPLGRTRATRSTRSCCSTTLRSNDPIEGPIRGFPTHPHRGIETVTYALEGVVRHRDSLGNMGEIDPGDVQWMTSGRGILHEEMPAPQPQGRFTAFNCG